MTTMSSNRKLGLAYEILTNLVIKAVGKILDSELYETAQGFSREGKIAHEYSPAGLRGVVRESGNVLEMPFEVVLKSDKVTSEELFKILEERVPRIGSSLQYGYHLFNLDVKIERVESEDDSILSAQIVLGTEMVDCEY